MVAVRAVYGPRALIGAGELGLRPAARSPNTDGPQIAALPYLLPPMCSLSATGHIHTCAGLDGQEHPREDHQLDPGALMPAAPSGG
jgi:hypothetical protein